MIKTRDDHIDNEIEYLKKQQKAWEISLSDIITSDEYKELCPTPDMCGEDELWSLLYKFGMDTNCKVTSQSLRHRNWKGGEVNCLRWVGTQRKDPEWVKLLRSLDKYQNK